MPRHAILNSFAAATALLCACANGPSVAQSEPENSVPLDELEVTSLSNGGTGDARNFKLLGMPESIQNDGVLLNWPGSGAATRFEGSQLLATIDGNADTYLDIQINDVQKTIQLDEGRLTYRLIDATPGTYDVSFRIRTERAYRPIKFEGFTSEDGVISAPERSELQLLVIGDDVATGYGIEGEDQFCTYSRETQNANLSFASLVGQDLNADVAIVARSGRGLAKNWNNAAAPTMADFYGTTAQAGAMNALGEMDAVIVQLGAMDIAQSDMDAGFRVAYADLLDDIRADHPDAEIVAAWGPMGDGDGYAAAKTVITELVDGRKTSGDDKVSFIEFTTTEFGQLYGCDWHPSADTQRFMATSLTAHLANRLSLDVDVGDLLLGG
ncbi:MAG: GDSL-type esterase/lipase family protein [Pseudomonadota bacterium]